MKKEKERENCPSQGGISSKINSCQGGRLKSDCACSSGLSAIGSRCRFRRNPILGQNECVRSGGLFIREPSTGSRVCYLARDREQCEEEDVKVQCVFNSDDR